MTAQPVLTIGHSTHPAGKILQLATRWGIDTIVDVRSHPTSKWEQHRKENLERWLPQCGVAYEWWPAMGGWTAAHEPLIEWAAERGVDIAAYSGGKFPKHQIAPDRQDAKMGESWVNQGLYDYSWFTALEPTMEACDRMAERAAGGERLALMCAEGWWEKCHRQMLADYLAWTGAPVEHVGASGAPKPHDHRTPLIERLRRYDPEIKQAWKDHADRVNGDFE